MRTRSVVTLIIVLMIISGFMVSGYLLLRVHMSNNSQSLVFQKQASIHNITIHLAFARTGAEQEKGLSRQKGLPVDSGLYFVFDHLYPWGIWMKDMNFPIDVLWFNEKGEVIFLKSNFDPKSFPEVATPVSPAKFVLEVPAGFVVTHQISLGDTINFPEIKP